MRIIVLLAALFCACVAPSQHDESRFGQITVAFKPSPDGLFDWRSDQLTELRAELRALNALGPTFVETTDPGARILVRPFDSGPGCAMGVGRFTFGTNLVEIDYACTRGFDQLRAALGHEIGHALGMTHVCFRVGELSNCSPVGIGPALMNPQIAYGDLLDAMDPGDPLGVAQDVPTSLDLAEFSRTR